MHRKRMCRVLAAALAAAGVVAVSASADAAGGTQLNVGRICVATPCVSTFPAGEPFFVRHGFTDEARSILVDPSTRYELSVDGVAVPSAIELDVVGDSTAKYNVSSFRFGMTGTHVFVGCWYHLGALDACAQRTVTFVS